MADDKGLVVQLRAGGTRILFMSDAGHYTEDWLTKNIPDELRSDILTGKRAAGRTFWRRGIS